MTLQKMLEEIETAPRRDPAEEAAQILAELQEPTWSWPDCRHRPECNGNGERRCGFLAVGPPLHCRRYEPVEGTRLNVAQQLNAFLEARGQEARIIA